MTQERKGVSQRRSGRGRKTILFVQLLLVAGLLLGVWFSLKGSVLDQQRETSVPEHLGALRVVDSIEGAEALAQVDKLHGVDIDLVSAAIAHYADQRSRVTVWLGMAESEAAARELTRRMVEGIERGGPDFGGLRRLSIAGHDVFQVDGPGGRHFFYNSWELRERVVWLTVEAGDALTILEEAVKTF